MSDSEIPDAAGDDAVWDELPDNGVNEARMIVNGIAEAKKRKQNSVVIRGSISPAAIEKLREKRYSFHVSDQGFQISWLSDVAFSDSTKPVVLDIPAVSNPSIKKGEQLSTAYLMMQQREADDALFRAQIPRPMARSTVRK